MGRLTRHVLAALGVALLLATGCSDSDPTPAADSPGPSSTASGASTTAAGVTTTVTSPAGVSTTRPASATTAPSTPTTVAGTGGPATAEAGGWRLVVTRPAARATIPPVAMVCYEATGSSREPDLVLEATVLPSGPTARVPVQVGRGTARVDLTGAGLGGRDLRIQLVVNGQRIDGLAVTIPVTFAADAPTGACP